MCFLLLSMGGNFLRLIHATPECVKNRMLPRVREGEVTESSRLLMAELRDYSIKNYKAFIDATTLEEAWSSDDSDDTVERKAVKTKRMRGHWAFINAWDRF